MNISYRGIAAAALGLALVSAAPLAVAAQLPQASAAALGLGSNMTASARSFAAVANNPAGLGHPESAGFSLAVATGTAQMGIGPVGLADLNRWQGEVVPDAVKEEWLTRVSAAGGQSGAVFSGASPLALSFGPIGFQLSAVGLVSTELNADAVELLLYGNRGRTGVARDFDIDGSSVEGFALSTAALSFGFPVAEDVWLGVTGKYTVGHAPLLAGEVAGTFSVDPLELRAELPAVVPRTEDPDWDNGSGYGMDLGLLVERGSVTLGASVQNVVHTFAWRTEGLSFVPGEAVLDLDGGDATFDELPAADAPEELLAALDAYTLRPVYSVGLAFRPADALLVTSDVRVRSEEGLQLGPAFHAGVGAELGIVPFLPLRGHFAVITGGTQMGGGVGLHLGPVQLSADVALRRVERRESAIGAVALSFGAR